MTNQYDLKELDTFLGITDEDKKNVAFLKKKDSVLYLIMNKKVNSFDKELIR